MTQNPPDLAPSASPPSQPQAPTSPDPTADPAWPSQPLPKPKWKAWHTLSLLAIIIAIVLLGLLPPSTQRLWAWIGTMVFLAGFVTVAGHGILGLWMGLLIDERNKMSLSRLQMILWTILVLSGFLTAALWNIRAGQVAVLSIAVPQELWLLMGVATTSLIGSPLIKSTKTAEPVAANAEQGKKIEDEKTRTWVELQRQGLPNSAIDTQGKIVIWNSPGDARWSDLFQGEEIGNAAHLDLGKIQMFYFTLILVLTYAVMLGALFSVNKDPINALPSLPENMVALLGISHAGYLVNKVVPHSLG